MVEETSPTISTYIFKKKQKTYTIINIFIKRQFSMHKVFHFKIIERKLFIILNKILFFIKKLFSRLDM